MDSHEWTNREDFMALVANLPRVKLVIYGHIHQARSNKVQGCEFLSCPSTCWQWAQQSTFAISQEQAGFRVLNLMAGGGSHSQIIRV